MSTKTSKRNIHVIDSCWSRYANWMEGTMVKDMRDAELVVLTGGEDINPALYGRKPHPTTSYNDARDKRELEGYKLARSLNKHIIGICRGAQLICAMNGGILIQDQDNPHYMHNIYTYDGKRIPMTSMHHQAAYPFILPRTDYKILGWTNNLSDFHYGEGYDEQLPPPKECEIVLYPKTRALGIQGHPEAMTDNSETIVYLRDLLDKFMADKI